MTLQVEVRLFVTLVAVFVLPGSAALILSQTWRHWPGLQRFIAAVGLSIAFYPVLYYIMRFLLPQAVLSPAIVGSLLLLSIIITVWGVWRYRAFTLRLSRTEWAAVGILALTFVSRFWFVYNHPYPAWSDSLHHTLLTQLVAENGHLPYSLEPYFPNDLSMYHLGLYAVSGTVMMLAEVPAHNALLWTAQFLNALAGIGVYLVLDRYAGRTGAIVGLALAGLFSAHPALWANWGRFTQLSSQIILLIAWVFTIEGVTPSRSVGRATAWLVFFSALLTAAVFLFHFRVAVFYLPLLAAVLITTLRDAENRARRLQVLKRLAAVSAASLLIVLPALWAAGAAYLAGRLGSEAALSAEQARQNYYYFPLSTIPYLAAPLWLLAVGGLGALLGLARRNRLIISSLVWLVLLVVIGNLYVLNLPILNVTNIGAILIMVYLPLALVIGAAAEELLAVLSWNARLSARRALLLLILFAALPAAYARANSVEQSRHFVMPSDLEAMAWIEGNVPDDATFAINTYFWLPNFAHGTDAGYWIPYFTGRHIVTSSMLTDGLTTDYRRLVLSQSQASEKLATDLTALNDLVDLDVDYVYIGARGDFSGPGLNRDFLLQSEQVDLLYQSGASAVLRIHP
jgi:hypothetical protein